MDSPSPRLRVALHAHPDWGCSAIESVSVDIRRPAAGRLVLNYLVTGRIEALRIPAPAACTRTDDLWRHTCFEAFVRDEGADYREYNFSPSTQWAAYRFTGYREGMTADTLADPEIVVQHKPGHLALTATFEISPAARVAALTAVLEDGAGWKSYWALRHPPGKPDFHHADGFAFVLPPPDRP